MNQAMHLISGDTLHRQITAKNSRLAQLLEDSSQSDEEIVKRLFLAALVREPDAREISLALAPIRLHGPGARRQAFEDALWALFNSKEFAYNH